MAVDGRCPDCDSTTLRVAYDDPHLRIACEDCGATVVTDDLLPAEIAGRDSMATLRACNRRAVRGYETAIAGSCPTCNGRTEGTVESSPQDGDYACVAECSQCALRLFAPAELPLFGHPAVIAFDWEHGVDVTDLRLWRLPAFIDDADRRVLDDDPLVLQLTLHHEGTRLSRRRSTPTAPTARPATRRHARRTTPKPSRTPARGPRRRCSRRRRRRGTTTAP